MRWGETGGLTRSSVLDRDPVCMTGFLSTWIERMDVSQASVVHTCNPSMEEMDAGGEGI